jgi:hypothetical protein
MLGATKGRFFEQYAPEARTVPGEMLNKYLDCGTTPFEIPKIHEVSPISERSTQSRTPVYCRLNLVAASGLEPLTYGL